ncbi:FAD-dependent oxidoreductase [Sinimarinibacterium sp. NLF-5-8]|uniref:FAD-dependent oxidoreductase n=1 Tax=Sinimarinibacterium sp. NLF-5-8 TaxID=2698684 RepID=UPI00137B95DF|nr:FAD-dependent oxidoreductase [Sinimarinibacterium sp. NLF-5-8]QHS10124.1 2-octaprenyl-6-methoxyphenyl hydroxylase [Sinimarinibacterium sp. NLF-5-8]
MSDSARAPQQGAEADIDIEIDIAIVGGGLIGASIALELADSGYSTLMLEAFVPPPAPATWDERCIAVNAASQQVLQRLGLWPTLAPLTQAITRTHIGEQGRFGVARFDARDSGHAALGYNIPIRALGEHTLAAARARGCTLWAPAKLIGLQHEPDRVRLSLDDGRQVRARLVIAADGMHSPVRNWLGIGAQTFDYQQSAIVTAVRTARSVDGCAYERFTPGGPIALLPKPWQGEDRVCSLIWTTPTAQLRARMALSDADFLAAAQATFGERAGRFLALGKRQAHPLTRVVSGRIHATRVVLIGNAAQSLHPAAAQGFNLGLRDVAALGQVLRAQAQGGGDPGEATALQRYAALRESDRARTALFTDSVVRLFSNRVPGLRHLRHLGLLALDMTPALREAVMWQNLGYGDKGRL